MEKYTKEELAEKSQAELVEIANTAIAIIEHQDSLRVDRRAWAVDRALASSAKDTDLDVTKVISKAQAMLDFILTKEA